MEKLVRNHPSNIIIISYINEPFSALKQQPGTVWHLDKTDVTVRKLGGREFASRKTGHPLVASFRPFDFSYWYDAPKGYIGYVTKTYLGGEGVARILQTAKMVNPGNPKAHRNVLAVAGELRLGKGSIIISQLEATERISYKPVAAAYFKAIVDAAGARRH
ncbi:MAG: hypothetical protein P8Z30_15960 [Acidobacteriota bacterium]